MWSSPLDVRLTKLEALSPFTAVIMLSSASDNTCVYVQRNISQPAATNNIAAILEAKTAIVGAVDGLIFTPTTSDTFGTSILTFKWQDLQDFKVDTAPKLERSARPMVLPPRHIGEMREPTKKNTLSIGNNDFRHNPLYKLDMSSAESRTLGL